MKLRSIAAAVAAMLLYSGPGRAGESALCPAVSLPPIALPHVQKALRHSETVRIVAFGSSSTAGARASDARHTYPAMLETDLDRALPGTRIVVLNRGIGGQDATEMLARIGTDVLAATPTLVIWQVGANGALRHIPPAEFRQEVDSGVRRIEASGADVILMDNQRSPAILASPEHAKLDQALADVAVHDHARLFARGRLMGLWQEAGYSYADFLAGDGIHHNDRGYACIARALAAAIVAGLEPVKVARLQAAAAESNGPKE